MAGSRSRQAGVALAMGLIMLVLLTLLVLSAINSGTINLRIARNVQAEDEARASAQQAIEQFVSVYANFYPTPTGKPATGYDVNNDGTNDYSVTVATPVCKRAALQIPPRSLDCASGVKAGLYCWDTLWEVQATASDTNTGALQIVTQGVAITFPPAFTPTSVGC
jgi:Tfp pilus assembly protein PilX